MIHIETYNRNELQLLIDSETYNQLPFLPISYHRAVSHIHHPRADEQDTLLLLAFQDQQLVGYLGVLADWIFDAHSQRHKCGWLSCMWVHESSRGLGISKKLVNEALKKWDQKILVTEFTHAAKGLYDKTGAFKDLQVIDGIRLYIRSDLSKLMPPKGATFLKLSPLWKWIDRTLNLFLDLRFMMKKSTSELSVQSINSIDIETEMFITKRQTQQLFQRNRAELDWMLQYPWVKSSKPDKYSEKYHFSSVANIFEFKPLKILDTSGNIIAFLILARRDDTLKIPYCYVDQENTSLIIPIIRTYIIKWGIKTCTFFHPLLVQEFHKSPAPALFRKSIKRHYIISKVFEQFSADQKYEIQDGDADCAFT